MLAARGTRDPDSGEVPVEDEAERSELRARGRSMTVRIVLVTLAYAACVTFLL